VITRPSASIGILLANEETACLSAAEKEQNMLGTILIVILVLALLGVLPRWPHSKDWGYFPTGGLGLVLLIVIVLLVLGRI
jgi:hypothetical protein